MAMESPEELGRHLLTTPTKTMLTVDTALALLERRLGKFADAEADCSAAFEEGGEPTANEYERRDDLALSIARDLVDLLERGYQLVRPPAHDREAVLRARLRGNDRKKES